MSYLEVRDISNKYGSLLHLGTKKRLDISQPHIENVTHEIPLVKILETYDYDYFVDVGAGYGYFSSIASHYVKKYVLSVEPHPIRNGFLNWNLRNFDNVLIYSQTVGIFDNDYYMPDSPSGMIGAKNKRRTVKNSSATMPLDSFYFYKEMSAVIKIDVEGNEKDVLESGVLLRGNCTNVIWLIELHREYMSKEELFEFFPDHKREKILDRKSTEHWKFWKE